MMRLFAIEENEEIRLEVAPGLGFGAKKSPTVKTLRDMYNDVFIKADGSLNTVAIPSFIQRNCWKDRF